MKYLILGSIVVLAFTLLVILSYNKFVTQKVAIRGAWAGIDVELKRRHDLIPNLLAVVKGYADFESSTLVAVTNARAMAIGSDVMTPSQREGNERALNTALKGLLAVVESYPDLKASREFLDLQTELTNTEDRIAAGRRFYNATVRMYQMRVFSFPSSIIARVGGFQSSDFEFFQAEEEDKASVKASL